MSTRSLLLRGASRTLGHKPVDHNRIAHLGAHRWKLFGLCARELAGGDEYLPKTILRTEHWTDEGFLAVLDCMRPSGAGTLVCWTDQGLVQTSMRRQEKSAAGACKIHPTCLSSLQLVPS